MTRTTSLTRRRPGVARPVVAAIILLAITGLPGIMMATGLGARAGSGRVVTGTACRGLAELTASDRTAPCWLASASGIADLGEMTPLMRALLLSTPAAAAPGEAARAGPAWLGIRKVLVEMALVGTVVDGTMSAGTVAR